MTNYVCEWWTVEKWRGEEKEQRDRDKPHTQEESWSEWAMRRRRPKRRRKLSELGTQDCERRLCKCFFLFLNNFSNSQSIVVHITHVKKPNAHYYTVYSEIWSNKYHNVMWSEMKPLYIFCSRIIMDNCTHDIILLSWFVHVCKIEPTCLKYAYIYCGHLLCFAIIDYLSISEVKHIGLDIWLTFQFSLQNNDRHS